ncbi:hypothetical protein ABMA28_003709 [Loxostege sticticalis]|uniref:BRCT domain-containing protein n=1 Tax=Loxostege sticticalis TaxID=481309 RepID=A0ABD0SSS7_LOXSC
MPRVKIDYVVSFSSEDPENPASNLLAWEVSKKRWLCAKGEPSCSVVLQLPRAVKISAVQVGAHHAALVEVLVGRSEKPNEPFQVLVPSCIFLTPAESRKNTGAERVRSFSAEQLSAARDQRWDRVRVVCSQPYNKHCKYGLNFVHISEPEGSTSATAPAATAAPVPAAAPAPAIAPAVSALLGDAGSSSDDEFRPGELFAKHKSPGTADTGAQIRQATSQALKNISDSATKLVKTPISKQAKRQAHTDEPCSSRGSRQRDDLMYTDDDDRPHAKIDHIVQRHKDERSKEEAKKPTEKKHDRKTSNDTKDKKEESQKTSQSDKHRDKNERTPKDDRKNRPDPVSRVSKDEPSTSSSRDKSEKDRKRSRDDRPQKAGGDFNSILKGVTFALSGYVNPRRANVRDKAIEMGARCERDWNQQCNYLICAFPNTPKLKQVRGGPGGATVPVARAEWVEECYRLRRRLPWRWYATEPHHAQAPPRGATSAADDDGGGDDRRDDDECDTDDEIEKAMRKQKKRRTDSSPSSSRDKTDHNESSKRDKRDANVSNTSRGRDEAVTNTSRSRDDVSNTSRGRDEDVTNTSRDNANVSNTSDVMFVRDERMQGNVTVDDSDDDKTDEEDGDAGAERIDKSKALPDLFTGSTFVIDASVARAAFDTALLARYVRAYGGIVMDEDQLDSDSSVSYVLSADGESNAAPPAQRVRPDWVWRCHAERRLHPLQDYLLT